MSKPETNTTIIDPGPRPRRPQSNARYCCWILAILGFTVVVVLLKIVWDVGYVTGNKILHPHQALYHDEANTGTVIRPLIDHDSRFDIAVTVWIRAPETEQVRHRASSNTSVNGLEQQNGRPVQNGTQMALRTPLFSDILFRNLSIKDRHVRTNLSLRIPIEKLWVIFCHMNPSKTLIALILHSHDKNLSRWDLLASIVIIPNPPLSHLVNFSSWFPDSLQKPAARTYPYALPLHS